MENKKYFKKLIKHYLDLKKYESNKNGRSIDIQEYILKINKILDNISKLSSDNIISVNEDNLESSIIESIDSNNFGTENNFNNILSYIKKYCMNRINIVFDESLNIENKVINNNIFVPIEEGNLEAISISESFTNFRIYDDNGMTPLHACIKNGDTTILKKFLKSGESIDLNNKEGHTLLEYACELRDPNLISFLILHGSNPKKHLFFRENNKDCKMLTNDIDLANMIKICLQIGALSKNRKLPKDAREKLFYNINDNSVENSENKKIYEDKLRKLCFSRINEDHIVGLGNLEFNNFFEFYCRTLFNLDEELFVSYLDIISDEFNFELNNRLGCPSDYFEILIIYLFPYIKYDFNISTKFIVINELVFAVRFICEKNHLKLNNKYYEKLMNKLWKDYRDILSFDFIGINLSNIFGKIKNIL